MMPASRYFHIQIESKVAVRSAGAPGDMDNASRTQRKTERAADRLKSATESICTLHIIF